MFVGGPAGAEKGKKPSKAQPVAGAIWLLALSSAAALGVAAYPPAAEWLAPSFEPGARIVPAQGGPLGIALGAALVGWALARARYGEKRAKDWAERDARMPIVRAGAAIAGAVEAVAAGLVARLRGASADTERWVLDGLVNATGVLARALAWVVAAFDEKLVDGPAALASAAALRASGKLRVGAARLLVVAYALVAVLVALGLALFASSR
jgi:hypothetical protein